MKTQNIYKIGLGAITALIVCACTANYEKINKNRYDIDDKERQRDGYAISGPMAGMQSFVIPTEEHLHQFQEMLSGGAFGGYLANTPTWTTKFSTYNPPEDWISAPFNDVVSGFYTSYILLLAATKDPVLLAMADIMRVASMQRVTDEYGPIPYSKLVNSVSLSNSYDSQESIYRQMIAELDNAVLVLTANQLADPATYANYDNIYKGSVTNWARFANSLKLRIAIRLTYVNPGLAKQTAESAVAQSLGVITTNAGNAMLPQTKNPFELQVNQWGDDRAGADIVTCMKGLNDPRISKYFNLSTFRATPAVTGAPAVEGFYGLRSGIDVSDKAVAMRYSMPVCSPIDPLVWMNASEVAFLRAEGAVWGWTMGDTAGNLYNQGISLSFEQWGAAGAATYMNDNTSTPASYTDPIGGTYTYTGAVSTITIKWNDADNFERKQERVITQKWIAIYPLGNEAWAEFRRTGYPKLMPVVLNKSGGTIPNGQFVKRLTYPASEYNENRNNVLDAVRSLGGPDTQGTKLWWDKK